MTGAARGAERPEDALRAAWANLPGVYGWLTAVNHRAIGLRYVVTAFAFMLLAGLLALVMRVQLAGPGLRVVGPDGYNQLFTMHGTTMMFLFALPVMEGLGIYLVPLMIGTRDMAFPRLNAFGYWVYLIAGLTLYGGFGLGVAPDHGWFNYVPLAGPGFSRGPNVDLWVTMITFLEVAALVAAVELIVTVFKQRAPGMSLARMPLFVWAQVVMSFMIVFAMPPLMLVSVELMLDRLVGTHFFNPAAGGDALLWQHLFWIFGHPDVYIILIPALGVVSMIVPAAARRPIAGYLAIATSTVAIGFLSFGLWVHHMYATGVPLLGMNFFAAVGMMITIPNAVQIFAWIATIWRGRLRVTTPFLWVVGFLVVFILGGITGIMVASPPFDWQAHDTYFVVAHFHYVLVGGAVFPLLGAVEFWFPKASGRLLGERAGRASFWLTFVGFNVAFLPMHLTGLLGMPRRVYTYLPGLGWDGLNLVSTLGAFGMALGIGVFAVNVLASLRRGRRAGPDPWGAGTLEWATSSPPPPYNFSAIPVVRDRNPLWTGGDAGAPATVEGLALGLEPGARRREVVVTTVLDAAPDHLAYLPGPSAWPFWAATGAAVAFLGSMVHFALVGAGAAIAFVSLVGWLWPRAEVVPPPRHGPLPRVVPGHGETVWWGMLLLITIEVTVFASLVFTYFYLRAGAPRWPLGDIAAPPLLLPTVNTAVLLASLVPVAWADRAIRRGDRRAVLVGKPIGQALLVAFLAIKAVEYGGYDYTWATNAYGSVVWTITGFHVAHVIVALLKSAVVTVLAARGYFTEERFLGVQANALYWYFVALVWIPLYATLYLTPRLLG